MSLGRSALEHLSIFYYLKDGVLSREFSQEVSNEPLILDPNLYFGTQRTDYKIVDTANSSFGDLPVQKGRGWVSFEVKEPNPSMIFNPDSNSYVPTYNTPFKYNSYRMPTEREHTLIKVRDQNGTVMDREWYGIDYTNGRIRFPAPLTPSGVVTSGLTPSSIDYYFNLVSLYNSWPDDNTLPSLPIVVIYPVADQNEGLQIGGGVKFTRDYFIDVFASNSLERQNLLDYIKNSLYNKYLSVIDFNRTGEPLKYWGVINEDFIQTLAYGEKEFRTYLTLNPGNGNILYFKDIEVDFDITPRKTLSDAMKYVGRISFSTETISDRDPNLVGKFSALNEPLGGFDSLITKSYSI